MKLKKLNLLGIILAVVLAFSVFFGYPAYTDLLVKYIHPVTSTSTTGVIVKNNAYAATPFSVQNSRGTTKFSADSVGNVTVAGDLTVTGTTLTGATIVYDTFAFPTTAKTVAIYISGLLPRAQFTIGKRVIEGVSTAYGVDSLAWQYMVKPDSLIVIRPNSNIVSGAKGSYIGIKY